MQQFFDITDDFYIIFIHKSELLKDQVALI